MIDLDSAMTPMSISVSLELETSIKAAAKECGVGVSAFCRAALEGYLAMLSEGDDE